MARPRKEIDQKQFEALLRMGCKRGEIVAFFDDTIEGGCCDDTIDRWCKRTYKENGKGLSFAEILEKKKDLQKISVRRAILQGLEDGIASIVIFAAKNVLGWSDSPKDAAGPENTSRDALADILLHPVEDRDIKDFEE